MYQCNLLVAMQKVGVSQNQAFVFACDDFMV